MYSFETKAYILLKWRVPSLPQLLSAQSFTCRSDPLCFILLKLFLFVSLCLTAYNFEMICFTSEGISSGIFFFSIIHLIHPKMFISTGHYSSRPWHSLLWLHVNLRYFLSVYSVLFHSWNASLSMTALGNEYQRIIWIYLNKKNMNLTGSLLNNLIFQTLFAEAV